MRKINDDKRAEFERLWQDESLTIKAIAKHFGCSEYAVQTASRRFQVTGRRRRKYQSDCHRCGNQEWCQANPNAEMLPCEKQATPHTNWWREQNYHPSPLNFWIEGDSQKTYR